MVRKMVTYLRMIEDKIREKDQIEAHTPTCVHFDVRLGGDVLQRGKELINRTSPHVSQHASSSHAAWLRGLNILRHVVGQIVKERLVRVVCKNYLQHINKG